MEGIRVGSDDKMYEFIDPRHKTIVTFTIQKTLLPDQILVIIRDVTQLQSQINKKLLSTETINTYSAIQHNIQSPLKEINQLIKIQSDIV